MRWLSGETRKGLANRNVLHVLLAQLGAGVSGWALAHGIDLLTFTLTVLTLLWLVPVWLTTSSAWYRGWLDLADKLKATSLRRLRDHLQDS